MLHYSMCRYKINNSVEYVDAINHLADCGNSKQSLAT